MTQKLAQIVTLGDCLSGHTAKAQDISTVFRLEAENVTKICRNNVPPFVMPDFRLPEVQDHRGVRLKKNLFWRIPSS